MQSPPDAGQLISSLREKQWKNTVKQEEGLSFLHQGVLSLSVFIGFNQITASGDIFYALFLTGLLCLSLIHI